MLHKINSYNPSGIFLSNGPGDPFATSNYTLPVLKKLIKDKLNSDFPDDAIVQLESTIKAVFFSWNGDRAKNYRKIENIPDNW